MSLALVGHYARAHRAIVGHAAEMHRLDAVRGRLGFNVDVMGGQKNYRPGRSIPASRADVDAGIFLQLDGEEGSIALRGSDVGAFEPLGWPQLVGLGEPWRLGQASRNDGRKHYWLCSVQLSHLSRATA